MPDQHRGGGSILGGGRLPRPLAIRRNVGRLGRNRGVHSAHAGSWRAGLRGVGISLRRWPAYGPHPGVSEVGAKLIQQHAGLVRRFALRRRCDRGRDGWLGQSAQPAISAAAHTAEAADGTALVDGLVVERFAEF